MELRRRHHHHRSRSPPPNHLLYLLLATITTCPLLSLCSAEDPVSDECNRDSLYPGVRFMISGVDITSIEIYSPYNDMPGTFTARDCGFLNFPIFYFTCRNGHTWTHPENGGRSYAVPDQVASINSLPATGETPIIRTDFQRSLRQFKELLAANYGVGGCESSNSLFGGFSNSPSYRDVARRSLLTTNRSLAATWVAVTTTQVNMKSPDQLELSWDFEQDVKKLPAAYEDDPKVYDIFVKAYGTHYTETGYFGAYLLQNAEIESEYLNGADEQEVSVSLEETFQLRMGLKNFTKGREDVRESLRQKSRSMVSYWGGHFGSLGSFEEDVANLKKKNLDFLRGWLPRIAGRDWPIGGKLRPIELLVQNGTIREQVRKAVAFHRARAHLKDLKHTVALLDGSAAADGLSADDHQEMERIERLLLPRAKNSTAPVLSTEQVLQAGRDGVDALLERIEKRRALAQVRRALERSAYIRDLRDCIQDAAASCDHALFRTISRRFGQPLATLIDRLRRAAAQQPETAGNGEDGSEELFYLLTEAGRLFYAVEHMSVEVPRTRSQCLRSFIERKEGECRRTVWEHPGGHRFKIISV